MNIMYEINKLSEKQAKLLTFLPQAPDLYDQCKDEYNNINLILTKKKKFNYEVLKKIFISHFVFTNRFYAGGWRYLLSAGYVTWP